jgi:hypothetical protein
MARLSDCSIAYTAMLWWATQCRLAIGFADRAQTAILLLPPQEFAERGAQRRFLALGWAG